MMSLGRRRRVLPVRQRHQLARTLVLTAQSTMRALGSLVALLSPILLWSPSSASVQAPAARFELPHDDVLLDEPVPIVVSGLAPGATVTVQLRGGLDDVWTSGATFIADREGRVDLTRMAPVKGGYKDVDAMGLFWSAERGGRRAGTPAADEEEEVGPDRWTLTAAVVGAVVARASLRRRAVAADVRVTPVRSDGLVGVFYEPAGSGRHPAMLVLIGSGGGIPAAPNHAGGLASRGYAVLALAYFGVEGLPRSPSNIPIEYFRHRPALARAAAVSRSATDRGARRLERRRAGAAPRRRLSGIPRRRRLHAEQCRLARLLRPIGARGLDRRRASDRRDARARHARQPARRPACRDSGRGDSWRGPARLREGRRGVGVGADGRRKIVARLKRYRLPYPIESLTYDHAGHAIARPMRVDDEP